MGKKGRKKQTASQDDYGDEVDGEDGYDYTQGATADVPSSFIVQSGAAALGSASTKTLPSLTDQQVEALLQLAKVGIPLSSDQIAMLRAAGHSIKNGHHDMSKQEDDEAMEREPGEAYRRVVQIPHDNRYRRFTRQCDWTRPENQALGNFDGSSIIGILSSTSFLIQPAIGISPVRFVLLNQMAPEEGPMGLCCMDQVSDTKDKDRGLSSSSSSSSYPTPTPLHDGL